MSERIFINYRHDDTAGIAGRLWDRLVLKFGAADVFMDVGKIPGGTAITQETDAKARACKVLLVLIGNRWTSIVDAQGRRRLDNQNDSVRREIVAAIAGNARIIPVLIDSAKQPMATELPEDIRALSDFKARELRSAHFEGDVEPLINDICNVVKCPCRLCRIATMGVAATLLGLALVGPGYLAPGLVEVTNQASRTSRTFEVGACHSLIIGNKRDSRLANAYSVDVRSGDGKVTSILKEQRGEINANLRLPVVSEPRQIRFRASTCPLGICTPGMSNSDIKDRGPLAKDIWFADSGGAISQGFNLLIQLVGARDHWCSWLWWTRLWYS